MVTMKTVVIAAFVGMCSISAVFEPFRARIGVDYGPRAIGVASSDPFGNVQPMCTLDNDGDLCSISNKILDMTRMSGALEVIIGLPLDSNGKMGHHVRNFNGQLCLNFSKVLSSVTSVKSPRVQVLLFDERYTTREAKERLKHEKVRASLDAMSAACLLERYLEDAGEGALLAQTCAFPPPAELANFDYNIVRSYIRARYYSEPLSDKKRAGLIMQNLKEGRSAREVRWMYGTAKAGKPQAHAEEEEDDWDVPSESEPELDLVQLPSSSSPLSSSVQSESQSQSLSLQARQSAVVAVSGSLESTPGLKVEPAAEPLTAADLEHLEYLRIKASRRKRGTLKRLHKKEPVAEAAEAAEEEAE